MVITSGMAGQTVRFWVDTDGDGDYSDETTLLNSNGVDDTWPLTQRVPHRGTDRDAITKLRSDR